MSTVNSPARSESQAADNNNADDGRGEGGEGRGERGRGRGRGRGRYDDRRDDRRRDDNRRDDFRDGDRRGGFGGDRRGGRGGRGGYDRGRGGYRGGDSRSERSSAIQVSNLKPMTEAQFKDEVLPIFAEQCGPIKLHSYQENAVTAVIEFEDSVAMSKVLEKMNFFKIKDSRINVEVTAAPSKAAAAAAAANSSSPAQDDRNPIETGDVPPNPTLVLKNLPFTMQESDLNAFLDQFDIKPANVHLHFDPHTQTFRGMAFLKYRHTEAATAMFALINDQYVAGRRVRVEFKRRAPRSTDYDPPDEECATLFEALGAFADDATRTEVVYPPTLSSTMRREIHQMAERLRLYHFSKGDGETRHIVVSKNAPEPEPREPRKPRETDGDWRLGRDARMEAAKEEKEKAEKVEKPVAAKPAPAPIVMRQVNMNIIEPRRMPKGPDGTRGFARPAPTVAEAVDSPAGAAASAPLTEPTPA